MADDRNTENDSLDARIAAAKAESVRPSTADSQAEGRGWAIGAEFVVTILITTFIGYFLDGYFNTKPWLMIVFLLLGFAAGTRRAMQTSKQFDADPKD
ncbi:MAG: synthase subunit [Sphingomonadales bacterium]|nr:synthase subunit [Sphingomonadales bacterium]